jgi:hypothetical protein
MSTHEKPPEHIEAVPIYIDRVEYKLPSHHSTGVELRETPKPPVPEDRDLWQEMDGPIDDELIRPEGHYEVKDWTHFYTAPRTINPGSAR